jgi:predicted patatin/cPLA2 family phospholipase
MAEAQQVRRSLVLAGGGMRVAYQAGAIRALEEGGITFSHADGASGGTINLAMLLSGQSPREMCDRWRDLNVHDFVHMLPMKDYLKPFGPRALGSADGLRQRVFPALGIDIAELTKATHLEGSFNVCNFASKLNEVIPHTRMTLDLLTACVSLPIFMPAVEHNGMPYVDSVWIQDANCMEAVRRGADEIWVIWCIGNTREYRESPFEQYVHMIELSANSALFEELGQIRQVNEAVARGERPYGRSRPVRVHLIKPEYPLPLDPDLYFGRISTAALIDMGYRDACTYISGAKPEGIALGPDATRMREPKLGLAFREVMHGPFAMHELDPRAGARRGRDLRQELTLHASIEVTDIERFVSDPQHAGQLTGRVDFAPLGRDLPSKAGVFNLMAPGDAHTKYMVYELGFEAGGQDYYLAGAKELRNQRGLDLWSDTTTLFSRLHLGRDKSGPVVGAGVLRLSPLALLRMMLTLSPRNERSLLDRAAALGKFGKFFSASLYDSYVHDAQA